MVPQIAATILVVWTTIIIIVLKVFDIVYAMTNGEYGTQVLANFMYRWTFISGDAGRGAAIAIIIMLAVVPVMIWNIRRARATDGAG
jgi:alpha-glucoside transport system permease protein